jgi:hypothetical protein
MKRSIIFTIVMLLIITVLIAGCTSNSSSSAPSAVATSTTPLPVQTTGSQLSTVDPSQMALTLSDVPAGFTLKEGTPLTSSDVSPTNIADGWIKGYEVEFQRTNNGASTGVVDVEFIAQVITVYPIDNVNQVMTQTGTNMLQESNATVTVEQLPDPQIGDSSQAFKITGKTSSGTPMISFFITFSKDDVVETLAWAGTSADYSTLNNLANIAEAKIK